MEPESGREDWQESGYGSLGYRDSETDCCDSLEETTHSSAAVVNQLTQTVSWTEQTVTTKLSHLSSAGSQQPPPGSRRLQIKPRDFLSEAGNCEGRSSN